MLPKFNVWQEWQDFDNTKSNSCCVTGNMMNSVNKSKNIKEYFTTIFIEIV